MDHPFDRSGLASLEDLQTPEWRSLFDELRPLQDEFLAVHPHSAEYIWPRDALHTWSRVWEYPYVYHHLRTRRDGLCSKGGRPVAVDFGSGVTFFPFAICRSGFEVVCIDQDPVCRQDIQRTAASLPSIEGHVSFQPTEGGSLPLSDQSVDAVYSISVLEHVPEHAPLVDEFARVLSPGGLLLLTVDINLEREASSGIGPDAYASLLCSLGRYFGFEHPRLPVHPAVALTSARGPYPANSMSGLKAVWWTAKQEIIKPLIGRARAVPTQFACEGLILRRLGDRGNRVPECVRSSQDGC
jgi:SAM-dependent methyltransferase